MTNPPRPMRVMFLQTSMPVGGAEVLLVNLVRGLERERFAPEVVCLKEPGPLGEQLAAELPVHSGLLGSKYDLTILPRLASLMRDRQIDGVVTVGAGDKMFWGRLAAKVAGVPVIASALHSTGWPDGVGRLNRMLTPLTDAFIACAKPHGEHLISGERFPAAKVHVIPNGVDTDRFSPSAEPLAARTELGIDPTAPVVGILAALRPEKNHEMFLHAAAKVREEIPEARFLIIGDGPRRGELESLRTRLGLSEAVTFLGSRSDIPGVLAAIDVLALTSHNEANPVSILEAMACGKPVVATDVGSVGETVIPGQTGALCPAGDPDAFAAALVELLDNPLHARQLGAAGRELVVADWSLQAMIDGYQRLLSGLLEQKTGRVLPASERSDLPAVAAGEPSEPVDAPAGELENCLS
ncbi:putative glycosyltransferase EpsF [Posidoniimonas polymericola]|uniref:Putative glycosyltransferase EpsF n=1 Tax=Posidoniimonas polymericola TaxID=2528002 RepID=A0A5C5YLS6_9BACT|nr:glycosyltransferase [Posidoniimonas polymericola]TWT75913.1 putative glycosyltransferase EpsF [Posidoniimonas polymericola]